MVRQLILEGPTAEGPMPPIHPKTLESFEARLGRKLPSTYRRLLLIHNGGNPKTKYFLPCRTPNYGTCVLNYLFGIDDPAADLPDRFHTCFVDFWREKYAAIVPDDFMPIGQVDRDNLLMLCVRGKRFGQIHEKVISETKIFDANADNSKDKVLGTYFVAKSFAQFVGLLRADDPLEPEIEGNP